MKTAIVYDWIDKWGGVERVLLTLSEMFPKATFFTSYVDLKKAPWATNLHTHTSFIQKLPQFVRSSRILSLPFYPYAFESFDFSQYDLVISVTSSFAKGIITRPETKHICYLLTPTRFLWSHAHIYSSGLAGAATTPYRAYLREWDYLAAQRPDKVVSLSESVHKRCRKYYGRDSVTIYPPFDIDYWSKIKKDISHDDKSNSDQFHDENFDITSLPFFLVVSRLETYKMVDLVVEAFSKMPDRRLVIVGKGSGAKSLREKSTKNTLFLKDLSDRELGLLYTHAQALIMPQEEDFGYVSLEAQYFGCPVLAYGAGGACETVQSKKTGMLFTEQSTKGVCDAVAEFHTVSYNLKSQTVVFGPKNCERFSKRQFIDQFIKIL